MSNPDLTADQYDNVLNSMAAMLNGATLVATNAVFTSVESGIPKVTAEYFLDGERLKLHFFCDGPFPRNFGPALSSMRDSIGHKGPAPAICDYTPEVKSWYFEFRPTAILGTGSLVQLFVRRLADLVTSNAEVGK